jgi:hypothetical protein
MWMLLNMKVTSVLLKYNDADRMLLTHLLHGRLSNDLFVVISSATKDREHIKVQMGEPMTKETWHNSCHHHKQDTLKCLMTTCDLAPTVCGANTTHYLMCDTSAMMANKGEDEVVILTPCNNVFATETLRLYMNRQNQYPHNLKCSFMFNPATPLPSLDKMSTSHITS